MKYKKFKECINALKNNEFDRVEVLINNEDLSNDTNPASIALVNEIRRQLIEKRKEINSSTQLLSYPTVVTALNKKTVLIVTPVYNGVKFIDETIQNVLSQKGDYILYYHIQDGNSTDGTVELLRSWEEKINSSNLGRTDIRFTWKSETDSGMYDAICRGFEYIFANLNEADRATSIMSWINSDDLFAVNSLRTVCSFFEEHTEFDWLTSMSCLMNEKGDVVTVLDEPEGFSQANIAAGFHDGRKLAFIQQEGTFWRYSLWQKSGGLSLSFRLAGDWDLWRRFALIAPLVKIQTVLGLHRRHSGQLSADSVRYFTEIDSSKIGGYDLNLRKVGFKAVYDSTIFHWNIIEILFDHDYLKDTTNANNLISTCVNNNDSYKENLYAPTLPGGIPWPKISVITPSYNQGRYIAETIESVIKQGYPHVEHIIIDGGSTDETMDVVSKYMEYLSYVVSEPDKGQSDALNKGFMRSTGDILCWLNSDDQFAPDALFSVAMAFATSGADIISGICEVYEEGRLVYRHMSSCKDGLLPLDDLLDLDNGWNAGQFFYQPEVFFSRSLWERAGSHVREDCYYSMDYELWCRFAEVGAKLHVIGAPLARFRTHPEQKTSDPSKFKAELVNVRDRFASTRSIKIKQSMRPSVRWDRSLRVAMVNDLGARYGAGIAHNRIAAAIDMVGHSVEMFELTTCFDINGEIDEQRLISDVIAFCPDIVIFGNMHAANRESVNVVEQISKLFDSYWVTHDFWFFTGRCAYPGSCDKYLSGCGDSCLTFEEYPQLAPEKISLAWERKHKLHIGQHHPVILSNSNWASEIVQQIVNTNNSENKMKVAQIRLGAPTHLFRPTNRYSARDSLGIDPEKFVIAFSVSSLTDERKGGTYLINALRELHVPNISVLLIGNMDKPFYVDGIDVLSMGYVTDPATLIAALSSANVFVGPSIEETFGQVFIEAALVGTPSIGFDRTGVIDAIIDGITGLRVQTSVEALKNAILSLYNDINFCNSLGYWAKIYASNEFSLESCFRSLFNVWDELGVIDKFELPHKIGFIRKSEFINETLGSLSNWRTEEGVSTPEGPYPGIPIKFQWCIGQKTSFRIKSRDTGICIVRIMYCNPLFEEINVDVYINNIQVNKCILVHSGCEQPNRVDIQIDMQAGWNLLDLVPDRFRLPSEEEARELTFMFVDIELIHEKIGS